MNSELFFKRLRRSLSLLVLGTFLLIYVEWYHSHIQLERNTSSVKPSSSQLISATDVMISKENLTSISAAIHRP